MSIPIKLMVVGDASSGKTHLLRRYYTYFKLVILNPPLLLNIFQLSLITMQPLSKLMIVWLILVYGNFKMIQGYCRVQGICLFKALSIC